MRCQQGRQELGLRGRQLIGGDCHIPSIPAIPALAGQSVPLSVAAQHVRRRPTADRLQLVRQPSAHQAWSQCAAAVRAPSYGQLEV